MGVFGVLISSLLIGTAALRINEPGVETWSRRERSSWLTSTCKEKPTSISDGSEYPNVVHAALCNEANFSSFKSHPAYVWVLEHLDERGGQIYLDLVKHASPDMIKKEYFEKLAKQNDVGSPAILAAYQETQLEGTISPTMLRYWKVTSDLEHLFGSLENKRIAEVGVGYGGLAHAIFTRSTPASYTLVDLPDVEWLATKVLDKVAPAAVGKLRQWNNAVNANGDASIPLEKEYDLCISNYAASELKREIFDMYVEKLFRNCKAGYFTWDPLPHFGGLPYNTVREEFEAAVGKTSTFAEGGPHTNSHNHMVLWGADDATMQCWDRLNHLKAC